MGDHSTELDLLCRDYRQQLWGCRVEGLSDVTYNIITTKDDSLRIVFFDRETRSPLKDAPDGIVCKVWARREEVETLQSSQYYSDSGFLIPFGMSAGMWFHDALIIEVYPHKHFTIEWNVESDTDEEEE